MRTASFLAALILIVTGGCGPSKKTGANALHAAVQSGNRERIADLVRTNNALAFENDAGRTAKDNAHPALKPAL